MVLRRGLDGLAQEARREFGKGFADRVPRRAQVFRSANVDLRHLEIPVTGTILNLQWVVAAERSPSQTSRSQVTSRASHRTTSPWSRLLLESSRTLRTLGSLARTLGTSPADLLAPAPESADPWLTNVQRVAAAVPESIRPLNLGMLKLATRYKDERPPSRKRTPRRRVNRQERRSKSRPRN